MTSTEVLLRHATEADAAAVAEVYLAARRAAPMPAPVRSDDEIRAWVAERLRGDDETWVAESAGEVVGFARLAGDWLDDLYVVPRRSREGIGSALLELVKSLRPQGFCLWVFETNEPARRFYARAGLFELVRSDGSDNEERAPDLQVAWPGEQPLAFLRGLVDEVDAELGALLERRLALTRAIQAVKPVGGPQGRDAERERQIALRMSGFAPSLGAERLQRIVHAVITESLDAASD
ncbi:MAG TPA: GNAT family N-acetyltransferase [Nocardioidaceae bacterium]|nr:GNAT family N-acetyltransferase [Nocardioidaceae bacterium]